MITYTKNNLVIRFGTQEEGFPRQAFYALSTQQELCKQPQFKDINANNLITLKQTHSTQGYMFGVAEDGPSTRPCLAQDDRSWEYAPYSLEGDYLITNQPGINLGIATADCLPLIIHDPVTNTLGIAHAGWRGTADGIATTMLEHMQRAFVINTADTLVFLGPAARSCCYEVQPDFLCNFHPSHDAVRAIGTQLFFDTSTYACEQLLNAGILEQNINREYNICTICDPRFCSHRRDGTRALRQMTIASLVR